MAEGAGPGGAGPEASTTARVQLLGLSLRLRDRLSRHLEELLREFALIRVGELRNPGRDASLPARLLELATDLDTTYAPYRAQRAEAMDDALAAGEEFFDADYTTSTRSAGWVRHFSQVLDEADDFCRAQQHLLTLPASAEITAFRRWLFGEILRQLGGEAPRPWRGSDPRDEPAAPAAAEPGAEPAEPVAPSSGAGAAPDGAGRVVGRPLLLDPLADAVGAARRYVRTALRELGAEDREECGELAVSELVTNAVLHARTAFTVAVRSLPTGGVRVEVADGSPVPVQVRRYGPSATTGRGLQLVAAASHAWGIDDRAAAGGGPGKVVWFEPRAGLDDGAGLPGAEEWAGDLADLLT